SMREERPRAASCAVSGYTHPPHVDPRGSGALEDDSPQIDRLRSGRRRLVRDESRVYFGPDLVALAADGWPAVHPELRHALSLPAPQPVDRPLHDPRRNPAPPRVNECHRPDTHIDQVDRHTIGHRDGEQHPGGTGEVAVVSVADEQTRLIRWAVGT